MEYIALSNLKRTGQDERRQRSRRFNIGAPARFSWRGADGALHTAKGTTRDISLHGVFIHTDFVPIPGTTIEIHVTIPSLVSNGLAVRLTGTGTVLRVEPLDSRPTGFAAAVTFQSTGLGGRSESDS